MVRKSVPRSAWKVPRAASEGESLNYKQAGVDIDAGNELVGRIKKLNPNIGGFSGLYPFGDSYLVAGADGVGTKLKLAFDLDKHDTVGIDLVAMSVNDIVCCGAKPMFFLDYFATGALDVDRAEAVVKGIVEGCRRADCTLMGGETAEMPGFYPDGEYDLGGFAVGSVKQGAVIDGSRIAPGDAVLGLRSSGFHSNGYSLVRKVLELNGISLADPTPWDEGLTFGEALIEPTVVYVPQVLKAIEAADVRGCVHITGGGFPENIPRIVPKGLGTAVDKSSWEVPPVFRWVQEKGKIAEPEMFRTFNMGVGMVLIVARETVDAALEAVPEAFVMGEIIEGEGVRYSE
eukprot:CAMPEP_0177627770 /NCGR_PEP_ID=MMETSP0419_2-20121207/31382_1 /TAXON_ID=582737 /ORGANISM="Tetraselmis sp., Strain GSL018" /LENGTH=344 /DNA_ID=CAMNT_0019128949 /DNA_START=233 /DNA_END=1267 /DNA_ORIENTATION=+